MPTNALIGKPNWSRQFLALPNFQYTNQHLYFLVVATLDLLFTWTILQLGGSEVNPLADAVIQHQGVLGMIGFKYCFVILIILACEAVGRSKQSRGLFLSWAAIWMTCVPVGVAIINLSLLGLELL